jgi:hypothetical protein
MAACNGTTQLYCSPQEGSTVLENQTYALDYNAEFETLNGEAFVNVYLYHAGNSSLAESFLDVPNNGDMTFTVEDV